MRCSCGAWLRDSVEQCPECDKEFVQKCEAPKKKWEKQREGIRSILEAVKGAKDPDSSG